VQTVGGSMLICPTVIVREVKQTEEQDAYKIYLDMEKLPDEFLTTNEGYFSIINKNAYFSNETNVIHFSIGEHPELLDENIEQDDGEIQPKVYAYIIITPEAYGLIFSQLERGTQLLLLSANEAGVGDKPKSKIAIALNATEGVNSFPKYSISIIDLYNPSDTPKALFGYLNSAYF
jgi:hypothetical protein